jgi:hypothetical protein
MGEDDQRSAIDAAKSDNSSSSIDGKWGEVTVNG